VNPATPMPIIALDKVVVKCKAPGLRVKNYPRVTGEREDYMPVLCDKVLDTRYTAVYHEGSGLGTGGVLIHSQRRGLMPLVTPLFHPLHCEAHLWVSQTHHR
jgi:hypothetical protein